MFRERKNKGSGQSLRTNQSLQYHRTFLTLVCQLASSIAKTKAMASLVDQPKPPVRFYRNGTNCQRTDQSPHLPARLDRSFSISIVPK